MTSGGEYGGTESSNRGTTAVAYPTPESRSESALTRGVSQVVDLQNRLVVRFDRHAVTVTYLAFAFVYIYFGIQKLVPGAEAPVAESIALFAGTFGVPFAVAAPFIGLYETTLGLVFLTRRIRLAFFPFLAHMVVTIVSPFVIWYYAWKPPWLEVAGLQLPWAVDWFAAFALKNVVFVGAFFFLASRELGQDRPTTEHESVERSPPSG